MNARGKPDINLHAHHDSRFDTHVVAARTFASNQLGLRHVPPDDKVTVIHEDARPKFMAKTGLSVPATEIAWTIPETGDIIAVAQPDRRNPLGATTRLRSALVHEDVHYGTQTPGEHPFFTEALAGLGETRYLEHARGRKMAPQASHFVLERAGVRLLVPKNYRYYDSASDPGRAHSTQGLIAATGIVVSQQKSGVGIKQIMSVAKPGGSMHYDLLRSSLDELRPGLAREVETYPGTTDGIIQATAMIQDEGRRQGIIPPLPRPSA